MTAPYPWSDSLTVMRARGGKRMAKTIMPDGTIRDYDSGWRYDAHTRHMDGLEHLRTALDTLIRQPDRCVVRGALAAGETASGIRRLTHRDDETGDEPTLTDVPRRWLAIDAEGLPRPVSVKPDDLLACADIVLERLPDAFSQAAGIVQASGGHGIKPDIRLRLWYWCDRAVTGPELKRWLAGKSVDPSVFNPAQPIYTAAPVFEGGGADHISHRLADWPGYGWLTVPAPDDLAPPPRPAPEAVQPVCVAGSARATLYVNAALGNACARIRNATLRHPAILQEACSLARFVNVGLLNESDMHNALWSAAQGAGKDDKEEVKRMVAFAMAHPSTAELPVEIRHG